LCQKTSSFQLEMSSRWLTLRCLWNSRQPFLYKGQFHYACRKLETSHKKYVAEFLHIIGKTWSRPFEPWDMRKLLKSHSVLVVFSRL
jgi:hypothetical protein